MSKKGLEDTFVGVSVTHKPSWGCPSLEKVSTSRLLALVIEVTLLRLQLDKERRWPLFSLSSAVYLVAAMSRTLLVTLDDDVGEDVDDARRVVVGKLRNLGSRQSSSPILNSVGRSSTLAIPRPTNSECSQLLSRGVASADARGPL